MPILLDCALCRASTVIWSLQDVEYGCGHIEAGQVEAAIREYIEYMTAEQREEA